MGLTQLGADWQALSQASVRKGSVLRIRKRGQTAGGSAGGARHWRERRQLLAIKVIDVPPEAIKEIYGGVRTSDADLARAAELARGEAKRGLFVGHVSSHAFRIQKTGGVHH